MPNKIYVANEQTLQTVKTDVNGLHTKIGQTSDASTSSTVFGKLNGIGAKVSEWLAPIIQKIGEPSDTTSKQTMFGKVNKIQNSIESNTAGIPSFIAKGFVKSVQVIKIDDTKGRNPNLQKDTFFRIFAEKYKINSTNIKKTFIYVQHYGRADSYRLDGSENRTPIAYQSATDEITVLVSILSANALGSGIDGTIVYIVEFY